MKFKHVSIIIFFFLFFTTNNANAILTLLTPELAVNDKLKQCRTFQPTGKNELPDGWRYHSYEQSNYPHTHPETCRKLGYTYSNEELLGVKSAFRRMIDAIFIEAVLFLSFVLLITIALIIVVIKLMRKLRRKKKTINSPKP